MTRGALALLCLCVCLTSGCATNPVTGKQDLVLMSEAQELSLGEQAHKQTLEAYRVYQNSELQAYVDAIGKRLAAKSHRADLNYSFMVLDSTEINAFALPGGYIYITRGLLAYMNSEAELAAVLGHEIGHVTARHGVRQASSARATSLGTGLLSVFFPQLRQAGVSQTVNMLGTAVLRGYGREHELEADRLGAEYLARTGYDPRAMLDVVRTLKNHELFDRKIAAAEGREPRAYHGVFATHPDNDTRLQEIVEHAATLEPGGSRARGAFLKQLDGLMFGPNPSEGIVRGGRFVHPELGFSFAVPPGWAVQNETDQIVLGEPSGKALMLVKLAPVGDPPDPAGALRQAGVGTLSHAEAINPDGLKGVVGLAQVTVGQNTLPARVGSVALGQHAYVFAGVTQSPELLGAYDETLRSVPNSFRRLKAAEKKALKAQRIRIRRFDKPPSWDELAAGSPLKKLPAEQLKLLNANENTQPAAGQAVKIIE